MSQKNFLAFCLHLSYEINLIFLILDWISSTEEISILRIVGFGNKPKSCH